MNKTLIVLFLSSCLFVHEGCKQENETVKSPTRRIHPKVKPQDENLAKEKPHIEENLSELVISEAIPQQNDIELRKKFKQEVQQLLADKTIRKT